MAGIVLNGAASQYDRWSRALDPDYARVDGRSFEELLDFAVQYGALIRYWNLEDEPDGDWAGFFLTDPTILLARLASFDAASIDVQYRALQRACANERPYPEKFALLQDVFRFILRLARVVNACLEVNDDVIHDAIVAAIDGSLREALRQLKAYDEGAALPDALREPIGLDYSGFGPIWNLGAVCPDGSIYRGATRQRKINHALPYLDPIFYAFLDALSELRLIAIRELPATLATGTHKPQISLYMAFLRLFATAQNTINTFSARYADFYDRRVLREWPAGAIPDSVFLTFTLAEEEGVSRTTVPAATLFPAGQDPNGEEILYAADRALAVTSAVIAKLYTLRVLRGTALLEAPQTIVTEEIAIDATEPWPTFGSRTGTPATLGFSISSMTLLLTGGDRSVALTFGYNDPLLAARLDELHRATGVDQLAIFQTILEKGFTLFASTTGAWFPIEPPYTAEPSPSDPSFILRFRLQPTAPPVAPFGPTDETPPEMTTPDPALPSINAWLRQEPVEISGSSGTAIVHPLSLLASMAITGIGIDVCVSGLDGLAFENTDGELDTSAPFAVFGGLPVVGSYLQARSVELFSKTPKTLTIEIDWFNLPQNEDGFKGYYKYYVIGLDGQEHVDLFNNQVFRGAMSVVQPGTWDVVDDVCLFRTQNDCLSPIPAADGPLCPGTGFNDIEIVGVEQPAYYTPADSALRLTLTEPPYAFGNSIYAQNVLKAVIDDLPDASLCQEKCLTACDPLQRGAERIGDCLLVPDDKLADALKVCAAYLKRLYENCLKQCGGDEVCRKRYEPLLTARECIVECLMLPEGLRFCAEDCRRALAAAYKSELEACMSACLSPKKELHYPNDPWLPMAQSIRADYSAGTTRVAFFHLLPFGGWELATATLLPRFPYDGALFAGFNGLVVPELLTMLFRMTSSEAPASDPPPVTWDRLAGNRWTPISTEQVMWDTTNGLRGTGVLALSLPEYEASVHTVMPDGLQWLRASVDRGADGFPKSASITPNVTTATQQGAMLAPISAGTIQGSVQDLPYVATISQPIASFGGRPAEDQRAYQVRLAERLRHKDRAIDVWDYDRLVLERFPAIWKCAALPARNEDGTAPGDVLVVVVAGDESVDVVDPTTPLAPSYLMSGIQSYLQSLASPFVSIDVVNPIYVRIEVEVEVVFDLDADPGVNAKRLNSDLVQYLSPWFYDAARAAKQGRYANEDEISEFIQTRAYVDAMQWIEFRYTPDPATLDWYFLTSAPRHLIHEITEVANVRPR